MSDEPAVDVFVFVGGVVVQDQVDLEVAGDFAVDGFEEREELCVSMPGLALADDFAGEHVERGEQCRGVYLFWRAFSLVPERIKPDWVREREAREMVRRSEMG